MGRSGAGVALFISLLFASSCPAAWISEVSLSSRLASSETGPATLIPAYVELSALPADQVAELVIITARNDASYGFIAHVIPLAAGESQRVVADKTWPSGTLAAPLALFVQPTDDPLDLADRRSLLLFNQVTGLVAGTGIGSQQVSPGSELWDVVTFGAGGVARSYDNEQPLDRDAGSVILRPNVTVDQPWQDRYFVGDVDLFSIMHSVDPAYRSNPGFLNQVWHEKPEPASLAVLVMVGLISLGRQRRLKG